MYQLQCKINSINHDNLLISVNNTQLKRLWDELAAIEPSLNCSRGVAKAIVEIIDKNKLMQFLMGLNDSYDQVRNQILLLDTLTKC